MTAAAEQIQMFVTSESSISIKVATSTAPTGIGMRYAYIPETWDESISITSIKRGSSKSSKSFPVRISDFLLLM